jgi:hypothetical protein
LNVVDDNEKRKQRVLPASFCHGCLLEWAVYCLLYSYCRCLAHYSLRYISAVCTDYASWNGNIVACTSQDIAPVIISVPVYSTKLKKHKISCGLQSGNILTKVRENRSSFTKLKWRDRAENTQPM